MQIRAMRKHVLLGLGVLGIFAAAFSALEAHVPWIASLCAGFGSGCQETAQFTWLHLPLWAWGIGFYVAFLVFLLRMPQHLHWLVAPGVGVEISLIGIMVTNSILCVFCLVNFAVIFLILILVINRENAWQSATVSLFFLLVFNAWLVRENTAITHGMVSDKPPVAAEVRGKVITFQQLEVPVASRLLELEQEAYELRKERLDNLITEMLLQEEADRRGITIQELVRQEVLSRGVEVSEADVMKYYDENRSQWAGWRGSEEQLLHRIRVHLENQKAYDMASQYARSLAGQDEVRIYLQEPRPARIPVNIEHNFSKGPKDAPVVVVEFSDYQCPACRSSHETVRQIREMYQGKIRWVFKDYPLRQHRWAAKAAEAARCAGDQGEFWEYQHLLYSSTHELNPQQLRMYAKELGLDMNRFDACLHGGEHGEWVQKDREDARVSGVTSTPTYIINGHSFRGAPTLERFIEMIEAAMGEKDPGAGRQ